MSIAEVATPVGYQITIRRHGEILAEIEQVGERSWSLRVLPTEWEVFCTDPVEALEEFYVYTRGE